MDVDAESSEGECEDATQPGYSPRGEGGNQGLEATSGSQAMDAIDEDESDDGEYVPPEADDDSDDDESASIDGHPDELEFDADDESYGSVDP